MLIVLHLMGNHGSYTARYPKEYNRYSEAGTIQAYDNSILYNDAVMEKLYERIQRIPNIKGLIYIADHADAVDQGLAHDASTFVYPMTHIPFYIWLSDTYRREDPALAERLAQAQHKPFTNDLLFNAMLGIMHIDLPLMYEGKNDITSMQYDDRIERFTTLYGKRKLQYDK